MAMAMRHPFALTDRMTSVPDAHVNEVGRSDITLLLELPRVGEDGSRAIESVSVLSDETIANVKLKLRARKGWFTSGHSLACGDRDLLDHEVVGRVAGGSVDFLHVFVRMSDVSQLSANCHNPRMSFDYKATDRPSPRKSALTVSLSRSQGLDDLPQRQLAGVNQPAVSDALEDPILHLVVRRGSKLGWKQGKHEQFELSVAQSETADSIRQRITATSGWDATSHLLLYKGQVLSSTRPLSSYGMSGGSFLELLPMEPKASHPTPSTSPPLSSPDHGLYEGWQQARAGLAKGHAPTLAEAGCGGSYFIPDQDGRRVAVFKPADEEPLAVNNPRNSNGKSSDGYGLRKGVCPGEGAVREVAAYLLDHGRFAGVPPTALVSCSGFEAETVHEGELAQAVKVGSLQAYVTSDSDCEERGTSAFPVHEVHKIAILDIRLVNTDRNGANILARRREDAATCSWELTPIDHGYCIPGTLVDANFEWLYWSQAGQPFSQCSLDYIRQLDAERDIALLHAQGLKLRPECERVLKVGTLVLKMGAEKGCTPRDIGHILCRQCTSKSPIEKLHARAVELAAQADSLHHESSRALVKLGHGSRADNAAPMGVSLVSDEVYLHLLTSLLEEYLDEPLMGGLQ